MADDDNSLGSPWAQAQTHYAPPPPNPTVEMVHALLGNLTSGPSWLDKAQADSDRFGQAFQHGGMKEAFHLDPGPTMDLAGGFAGTFAGIRDPHVLSLLKQAEGQGATAEDIWNNARMFKGLDTKYREYIPDNNMQIAPGFRDKPPLGVSPRNYVGNMPLQKLIEHPGLFSKIPELGKIPTEISKGKDWGGGFSGPDANFPGFLSVRGGSEKDLKNLLAHEIQHGAQDIGGVEGSLAPGESKSDLEEAYMKDLLQRFRGKLNNIPAPVREGAANRAWRDYKNNIGEIEANLSGELATAKSPEVNLSTLNSILYNPARMPTSRNVPWDWYRQQTPDVRDALRQSGVRALMKSLPK